MITITMARSRSIESIRDRCGPTGIERVAGASTFPLLFISASSAPLIIFVAQPQRCAKPTLTTSGSRPFRVTSMSPNEGPRSEELDRPSREYLLKRAQRVESLLIDGGI